MEINYFKNVLKHAIYDFACECEMKPRNPPRNPRENTDRISSKEVTVTSGNAVVRDNFEGDSPYIGFLRPEEETNSSYSDLSLVFFPIEKTADENKLCIVVSLTLGSTGLRNDIQEASLPGTRRLFMRLRDNTENATFFKADFSDRDTVCNELFDELSHQGYDADLIKKYKEVIQASEMVEVDVENSSDPIESCLASLKPWIAVYASFRQWGKSQSWRKKIAKNLPPAKVEVLTNDEIYNILLKERFIVLQGAPGTGKTFNALQIAHEKFVKDHVFFTQFHAETTYADFVWGIRPSLKSDTLHYEEKPGDLLRAIKKAQDNPNEKVLLIIDEINRANLSNVLGPVFYLFEKNTANRDYKLTIGTEEIAKLPDNLYVIATMNTADRSLAVVDFALRRRFTWLTLRPHKIEVADKEFHEDEFERIQEIFERYATDDELNLQPGQSYFITDVGESMRDRLLYEIMPLIKEYLNEGFLAPAKNEFINYFYNELKTYMYE